MEKRVLLALALSFLVLVVWSRYFAPPPRNRPRGVEKPAQVAHKEPEGRKPEVGVAEVQKPVGRPAPQFPEKKVELKNKYLKLVLSSRGAGIFKVTLLDYWDSAEAKKRADPAHLLVLFDRSATPEAPPAGALKLLDPKAPDLEHCNWELLPGKDPSVVVFAIKIGETRIEKTFRLPAQARHVEIEVEQSGPRVAYALAGPFGINAKADKNDYLEAYIGVQTAGGFIHAKHFGVSGKTSDPPPEKKGVVWGAVCRRYFAAILRGVSGREEKLAPSFVSEGRIEIRPDPRFVGEALKLYAISKKKDPGQLSEQEKREALKKVPRTARILLVSSQPDAWESKLQRYQLYLGPKDPKELAAYRRMEYPAIIRYGSFIAPAFLVKFFLALLKGLRSVLFDYGLAIVFLTLLVKAALHPLNKRNQKAMQAYQKKIQAIQPELEKIKERYKHNRQKMHRETQRLMQERGVNPSQMLGGCLLMLLQLPIWVALINVFRVSIELRQAPAFFGLIDDLSQPDKTLAFGTTIPLLGRYLNVLPILYIILTLVQQKLSPKPKDEQARQQQRMMGFMMIFFGVIFYNFSSGLLLYFLTSAFLGIIEQQLIRGELALEESAPRKR